jgi:hypothetical protein
MSDAGLRVLAMSNVNFTSSAVTGWPSCQRTSSRSVNVTAVSPCISHDSARYGCGFRSSSYWTSGVNSRTS